MTVARLAIFSDVHANLEALEAVFRDLDHQHVDRVLHLGDVVGYNASPCEVIDLLMERNVHGVQGNHDVAALDLDLAEGFNMLAYHAILYTRQQLDAHHVEYLSGLPFSLLLEGQFLLFHGSLESVNTYIANMYQAKRAFNFMRRQLPFVRIAFFGHTHVPKVWSRNSQGKIRALPLTKEPIILRSDEMYLINPGSVGQPRQKDSRAHYLIVDIDAMTVQFRSVEYNITLAQAKILRAKLPEFLATRLAEGI